MENVINKSATHEHTNQVIVADWTSRLSEDSDMYLVRIEMVTPLNPARSAHTTIALATQLFFVKILTRRAKKS